MQNIKLDRTSHCRLGCVTQAALLVARGPKVTGKGFDGTNLKPLKPMQRNRIKIAKRKTTFAIKDEEVILVTDELLRCVSGIFTQNGE
jgi:hypothetical protein